MTRDKLYILLSSLCLAGGLWLFLNAYTSFDLHAVCMFKSLTGLPCPACGSTRAVLALFRGDIGSSLLWNPFGLVIAGIMVAAPAWMVYDMLLRNQTLLAFYTRIEVALQKKQFAVPLLGMVLMNWAWNIMKGN